MILQVVSWVLIAVGAVAATGGVASLHRGSRGRWRADPMGRHLMGTMLSLAVILLINTVAIVVSMVVSRAVVAAWFVWPYLAAFGWVDYMLCRRWWLLRHPPKDSPTP